MNNKLFFLLLCLVVYLLDYNYMTVRYILYFLILIAGRELPTGQNVVSVAPIEVPDGKFNLNSV